MMHPYFRAEESETGIIESPETVPQNNTIINANHSGELLATQTGNREEGIDHPEPEQKVIEPKPHNPIKIDPPEPPPIDLATVNSTLPWFKSPIVVSIGLLAVVLAAFHVINQVIQFLSAIQNSWGPIRYAGYTTATILFLIFIWAAYKLMKGFIYLKTNPAFTNTNLSLEAKAQLHALVLNYPCIDSQQKALLSHSGIDWKTFYKDLENLKVRKYQHDLHWIPDFKSWYCAPLDKCAQNVVHSYSMSVAIKTAVAPNGILDTLIVWINAILMLEKLCKVYNLKPSRLEVVILCAKLVFTTFIVAKIDDAIEGFTENLGNSIQDDAAEYGKVFAAQFLESSTMVDAIGSIAGGASNLLTKFAGKAAEGAVAYTFFRRLGYSAIKALQPIST